MSPAANPPSRIIRCPHCQRRQEIAFDASDGECIYCANPYRMFTTQDGNRIAVVAGAAPEEKNSRGEPAMFDVGGRAAAAQARRDRPRDLEPRGISPGAEALAARPGDILAGFRAALEDYDRRICGLEETVAREFSALRRELKPLGDKVAGRAYPFDAARHGRKAGE